MHDLFEGGGGGELLDSLYLLDNVALTTIGVDVGSSTCHLMFGHVHLVRDAAALSSRYEVASREVLWRSGIELTPYDRRGIDADAVGRFVRRCHEEAGLSPDEVDSGAVILTGEALRQRNARALAEAIAADSGKFVCVSAGHALEALLAAHGSGAVAWSEQHGARLLNIDIGGGTTKLSLINSGRVEATAAVKIGGRQISWNDRREVVRTYVGAQTVAVAAGVAIRRGEVISLADSQRVARRQAEVLLSLASGASDVLSARLRLTPGLPRGLALDAVSFSGGVSEYLYGREHSDFGDLGAELGEALAAAVAGGRLAAPVVDPGEGIRATVVGASQCSVQLSGNTVWISDAERLPIYNVPVVHPSHATDDRPHDPAAVAAAIDQQLRVFGLEPRDAVAVALPWRGEPSHANFADLCSGIQRVLAAPSEAPVVVVLDDDVAQSVGGVLTREFPLGRPVLCLDGLELAAFDHIDVGQVLQPSGALPVVIKSLLFAADGEAAARNERRRSERE